MSLNVVDGKWKFALHRQGVAGSVRKCFRYNRNKKSMKTKQELNLSKKDLAERWKVSVRSVERTIRRYNLLPFDWFGRQPEFHPADVMRIESIRKDERMMRYLGNGEIITVKEAKQRAAKGGAK